MTGGLQKRGVILVAEEEQAFLSALKDANKAVASFDDATNKASKGVSAASEIMTGALRHLGTIAVEVGVQAARAIGAFVSDSISQAGDFESNMLRFGSITGDAITEAGMSLEDFSDLFLKLGADTQFSAAQAQEAAISLAKGGLTPAQISAGALADTLTLAAAGELDLAKAADITAKQLGVWADQGVTSSQVANLMAQAANASVVSVEELALGMANVGGVAKLAGASFQDTVTALGAVAAGFSSASDAGTSMKAFLMKLQPTTKPAIAAFKELNLLTAQGTSQFYDAAGNFVGFSKAADLLQGSLKGMSKAQQEATLQAIFGADGIRVAAILAEKGAAGFDAFAASMGATGSAADQAAAKNKGWQFSVDTLMGSIDTFKVKVLLPLLPVLTQFVDTTTIAVNRVAEFAGTFQKLVPAIMASTDPINTFFNALRVAIPEAVPLIGQVQSSLDTLIGVAQRVGAVAQTLAAPWIGAFASIAPAVQTAIGTIEGIVTSVITTIQSTTTAQLTAMQSSFMTAWNAIATTTGQYWNAILGIINPILTNIATFIHNNGDDIRNFFVQTWQQVSSIISTAMQLVQATIIPVLQTVGAYITRHGAEIQAIFTATWNLIKTVVSSTLAIIQGVISTVLAVIKGDWQGAWDSLLSTGKTISDAITNVITGMGKLMLAQFALATDGSIKTLTDAVGKFTAAGQAIIMGVINGIKAQAKQLIGVIGTTINEAVAAAKAALASGSPSRVTEEEIGIPFVQGIAVGIAGGAGDLQTLVSGLGTAMVAGAAGIVAGIKTTSADIGTAISSGFAKKTDDATEAGTDISSGLAKGIEDGKSEAISAAIQVATSAIDAAKAALGISSPSEEAKKRIGTPFVQGIIAGLEAKQAAADTAAMNLATGMIGAAKGTLEKTGNLATLIGSGGEAKSTALNASWQGLSNDLLSVKDAALLANSAMGYMESGLLKVNLSGRETAKQIKIMTDATIRATRGMQGKTVANLLEARTEEKVTAQTRLLELQTEKAVNTFLKINPQIDAAGIKSLVMAGKLDEATGKLILMEREARQAESALSAFEQLLKDAEQAAKDTADAIDDATASFRAFTALSVADATTGFANRQRQIAETNRTIAQLRGDTNVRDLTKSLADETSAVAHAKDEQTKLEDEYQKERAAILATTDFEQDYMLEGKMYEGRISKLAALDDKYKDDRVQASDAITTALTAQTAAQAALAAEQARVATNASAASRAQDALNAAIAESATARRIDEQAGNDLLALRVQQINELLGLESERADLQAQVAGGNEGAIFERDAVDAQIAAIKLAQEHDINALLATARERIVADLAAANDIDAALAEQTPALVARVQEIMRSLTAAAQGSLGIHSPSSVAQRSIGAPFGQGILLGISDVINTQLPALLAQSMSAMAMVMPPAPTIRPPASAPAGGRSYTDASSSTNNMTINAAGMSEARLEAMITRVINRQTGRANGIKATGGYGSV